MTTSSTPIQAARKRHAKRWLAVAFGALLVGGVFELLQSSTTTDSTTVSQHTIGQAASASSAGGSRSTPGSTSQPSGRAGGTQPAVGARGAAVATENGRPATAAPSNVDSAVAPPAPGRYAYRYGTNGQKADGTMTVTDASASSGGGTQRTETDRVGASSRSETREWSRRAIDILSSDTGTGPCRWSPQLTSWSLPLRAGRSWHTDSTCMFGSSQSPGGSTRWVEDAKVDGAARTTVGGTQVLTWVIERHTLVTETVGSGAVTAETQSTELFAPELGLVVYKDGRTATPNSDGTTRTTGATLELLDVHPS